MKSILFLDDEWERHKFFEHYYEPQNEVTHSFFSNHAINELNTDVPFDEIWLDHDLSSCQIPTGVDSSREFMLNSMPVVRWIIANVKPTEKLLIRIHSWNIAAAEALEKDLKEAGFCVIRRPFNFNPGEP